MADNTSTDSTAHITAQLAGELTAVTVLPPIEDAGWFFDTELLVLAEPQHPGEFARCHVLRVQTG